MRFRKKGNSKTGTAGRTGMLLFVFAAASVPLGAQQVPIQPNQVRQQLSPRANPPAQAKTSGAGPAASNIAVKASLPAGPGAEKPVVTPISVRETAAGRRDPFSALVTSTSKTGIMPDHLPAGKAGLMIATLHIEGVVNGPNGMIAVVTTPDQRVYFIRQGDHLYDGEVTKIGMDVISFRQAGKDPFGKPIEREIDKRLYPSPGEPQ